MVSRENLVVSYFSLLSAWIIGFALAISQGWQFSLASFNLGSVLGLAGLGLVCLVFCMMFFGRLHFLFFLALGIIFAANFETNLLLLRFLQALVLAWFGMTGVLVGGLLFEDLKKKKEFNLLSKRIASVFLTGVLFSVIIGFFAGFFEAAGAGVVNVGRQIRDGELTLGSILDLFWADSFEASNSNESGSGPP